MFTWCRIAASARQCMNGMNRRCSSIAKTSQLKFVKKPASTKILDHAITDEDFANDKSPSILAADSAKDYDFSDYGRQLGKSQTFAAFADKSPTLQKLVDLGVDLSRIEKIKDVPKLLLGKDFDRDIAPYLRFFIDVGVSADALGLLLTKNPKVLGEELQLLQTRIDYLKALKFEFKDFERIITGNPFWLMISVDQMQNRVDFIRKEFSLSMVEFRNLALISPKFITHKIQELRANTFSISVEMGFSKGEIKAMLMCKPRIWLLDNNELVERFHFLHNRLEIPHWLIAKQPQALLARLSHIRHRHFFLHSLGKAQYDPRLPNYVSLLALVTGSSDEFASNVAGASPDSFTHFLKTL